MHCVARKAMNSIAKATSEYEFAERIDFFSPGVFTWIAETERKKRQSEKRK